MNNRVFQIMKSTMITCCIWMTVVPAIAQTYLDRSLSPESRTEDLLSKMTLEEKVAQLTGMGRGKGEFGDITAGIFGTDGNERLGIPRLVMGHGITGVRSGRDQNINATYMMTPIGIASSWDMDLYAKATAAVAQEMKALNQDLNLGTTLNTIRHPLGGRNWECFSEDPYLTARLGLAHVKTMQDNGIISGPKHFVGNNQEGNRFDINNEVDERTLREIYLPAFKTAVIEGGALNIMGAYNRLNGTFMCENKWLLTDVLRNEWGFKGFVLSDFGHGVQSTVPTALSGMNIEMHSPKFYGEKMVDAVEAGEVAESVIDQLLREKLYVMFKMGLFDKELAVSRDVVHSDLHQKIALEVAREAAVLLKNKDAILPLDRTKIKKLAVIGPNAKRSEGHPTYNYMQGGGSGRTYHFQGAINDPVDEIAILAPNVDIVYAQGCDVTTKNILTGEDIEPENLAQAKINESRNKLRVEQAVEAAKSTDAVVLIVGLHGGIEREGWDRKHANLPGAQNELVKRVAAVNPNTVVVITGGSFIDVSDWIDDVKGVIYHFYCGEKIGQAMAEVLFGDVNPSGKLPISFPNSITQYSEGSIFTHPEGYSKSNVSNIYSEGIFVGYRYFDKEEEEMLFPFGYGLSYTNFSYSKLKVKKNEASTIVSVTIKNTGAISGDEIVQLYVSDKESSVPRPMRELKGFKRVSLQPGESKKVEFSLDKEAFSFWSPTAKRWTLEPGEFGIEIGASSRDLKLSEIITK